ncbi:lipoprotein [Acuticoccus mangrovi]|uniref:Lipoprotein n=1 Tax=Acuticoccus mangrovi TaxID=2796142 RepID=A0A934MH13_9HYPH|nr:lipoprotein [Acuticoccus mangrovi]MBJ3777178.1 hypothetical protein [Acuticoccus mangrovi]
MIRAALLLAMLAALAACGRAGSPEPPPGFNAIPRAPVDVTDPDGTTAPDRPFVLDPILQ